MFISYRDLVCCSLSVQGKDKKIGEVEDLLFEDDVWVTRYLLAKTSVESMPERVLVPSSVVEKVQSSESWIMLNLSEEQFRELPETQWGMSMDRAEEDEIHRRIEAERYWKGFTAPHPEINIEVPPGDELKQSAGMEQIDRHLRSMHAVIGARVLAREDNVGSVEDFLVDRGTWLVRFFVCRLNNGFNGKSILVSPEWVERFDWDNRLVVLDIDKRKLSACPSYDLCKGEISDYAKEVCDRLGFPKQWFSPESAGKRRSGKSS